MPCAASLRFVDVERREERERKREKREKREKERREERERESERERERETRLDDVCALLGERAPISFTSTMHVMFTGLFCSTSSSFHLTY